MLRFSHPGLVYSSSRCCVTVLVLWEKGASETSKWLVLSLGSDKGSEQQSGIDLLRCPPPLSVCFLSNSGDLMIWFNLSDFLFDCFLFLLFSSPLPAHSSPHHQLIHLPECFRKALLPLSTSFFHH